jgi:hypothetical protein
MRVGEPLAFDMLAAQRLLGWTWNETLYVWQKGDQSHRQVPRFTLDPAADYSVLKLVRETWESRQRSTWSIFLAYIHHYRARAKPIIPNALGVLYYEPGDYAAAALLCVDADAEGGKS